MTWFITIIKLLTLCLPNIILNAFVLSTDFFQNKLFRKNISGIPSECQTDWIQIKPDILSGLIWVQTVCKGYQQTTLVGKEFTIRQSTKTADISLPLKPLG